jgi:XTP/dITP diphosphohydrolase
VQLVLASGNAGKLREFEQLLIGLPLTLHPQARFGIVDAAETAASFVENALIKARHAARYSKRPALADDSGLVVDALGGAPGVRSARYAGGAASDADNIAKLLAALADVPAPARGCRFVCVAVVVRSADDPLPLIAQGVWEGCVLQAPRGARGFGYDPIFAERASAPSAAELEPARKHEQSHRGQALRALRATLASWCNTT